MSLLEIKNACLKLDNKNILNGVSLSINSGEVHAIMGPNGSGKSSLLGLLAGILYPESGKIYSYEKTFGYIGPVPLIFSETLKYNLLYGNKNEILDEEIITVCRNFDLSSGTISGLRDLKICNAPQKPNAPEKQKIIKLLSKSLASCSMPRTS